MNGLSIVDETYNEQTLASTDDLVRFWRTEVKDKQRVIDVSKAYMSMLGRYCPSCSCVIVCISIYQIIYVFV